MAAREHPDKPSGMQIFSFMQEFITNKRFISLCDVAIKTRSRNDLKLPLKPNAIVCVKGEKATLTEFFKLDIQTPFTLVTLENDEATPQDFGWLKHKHLHRWYSWNSNHPDVIPIPIGLNEDSQLQPMARTKSVKPNIPTKLASFKIETAKVKRQGLYDQTKDMLFTHLEPYHMRYNSVNGLTMHDSAISAYKWTLCPRGPRHAPPVGGLVPGLHPGGAQGCSVAAARRAAGHPVKQLGRVVARDAGAIGGVLAA